MPFLDRRAVLLLVPLAIAGCASENPARREVAATPPEPDHPNETPRLRRQIARHAHENDLPEDLLRRVVREESTFRPRARNGPYLGLMQIHPQTARTMGHDGPPEALLEPETNLRYGARYLRGAYIVADGDPEAAIRWYRRGYYYAARDRGLLQETGLR